MTLMVGRRGSANLKKVCIDKYSLTCLGLTLCSAKLINYLKQIVSTFFNQVIIFKDKLAS